MNLFPHRCKLGFFCGGELLILGGFNGNSRQQGLIKRLALDLVYIIKRFQEEKDPKVLIIQPQAASHGLTLTAANTVIWYAPVTSVETYLQANARINRPGQKNAMTIVHVKGSEVETRMYSMLRNNITNHNKIIELYKQEIKESA